METFFFLLLFCSLKISLSGNHRLLVTFFRGWKNIIKKRTISLNLRLNDRMTLKSIIEWVTLAYPFPKMTLPIKHSSLQRHRFESWNYTHNRKRKKIINLKLFRRNIFFFISNIQSGRRRKLPIFKINDQDLHDPRNLRRPRIDPISHGYRKKPRPEISTRIPPTSRRTFT